MPVINTMEVILFSKEGSKACAMLEDIKEEIGITRVVKDEKEALENDVLTFPTIIIKNDKEYDRIVGVLPKKELIKRINSALSKIKKSRGPDSNQQPPGDRSVNQPTAGRSTS